MKLCIVVAGGCIDSVFASIKPSDEPIELEIFDYDNLEREDNTDSEIEAMHAEATKGLRCIY